MRKALSAGKLVPGVFSLITPVDDMFGDSRTTIGPSTDELPDRFMAIISVWIVVRPPGPQPMQGSPRRTVDGPFSVMVSVPTPVITSMTLAVVVKVSVPAGGK